MVGFDSPFVSRRVTPRDLLSQFIGSMVCVEGIVTKCNFLPPLFGFLLVTCAAVCLGLSLRNFSVVGLIMMLVRV